MNVSEDLLNRQIQDYGLVSPERAKNLVWSYFKKYESKNLTRGHDNLKLQQQALCTICLGDQDRRRHSTVQLGKDNSPSSLMDHLRIHHREQHDTVVVASSKGLTLAAFNAQRKVNSEMGHDWQGCADHRLEKTVASFYKHEGQSQKQQFSKSSFVYVSVTHTTVPRSDPYFSLGDPSIHNAC